MLIFVQYVPVACSLVKSLLQIEIQSASYVIIGLCVDWKYLCILFANVLDLVYFSSDSTSCRCKIVLLFDTTPVYYRKRGCGGAKTLVKWFTAQVQSYTSPYL